MTTAIFKRYSDDLTTSETELRNRSGQIVTVTEKVLADPDDNIWMYFITFADGFTAEAFEDELTFEEEL